MLLTHAILLSLSMSISAHHIRGHRGSGGSNTSASSSDGSSNGGSSNSVSSASTTTTTAATTTTSATSTTTTDSSNSASSISSGGSSASSTGSSTSNGSNNNNGGNLSNNNGASLSNTNSGSGSNSDLTLLAANVQLASDSTGSANAEAGQSDSITDPANFINFCSGKNVTDGFQVVTGSCNGVVMGDIPASGNMISGIITNPAPGDTLQSNTDFNIDVQITNLVAGTFTNPLLTYYAAPQQLKGGKVIGHTHVVVQALGNSLAAATPPDPQTFAFFKGINDAGNGNGALSATVKGGLAAGAYRVCTMTSASNHQPVLMPVAQRGAQDDCTKFLVSDSGASSAGNGNAGNSNTGNANTGNSNTGNNSGNNNNNNNAAGTTTTTSSTTTSDSGSGSATSTSSADTSSSTNGSNSGSSSSSNSGSSQNGGGGRSGGGRSGRFAARAFAA